MNILVLNAGSSSQKSCLYQIDDPIPDTPPHPQWEAQLDWTASGVQMKVKTAQGATLKTQLDASEMGISKTQESTTAKLLETLWTGETQVIGSPQEIHAVGHRVVHGGEDYRQSTLITPEVKAAIAKLALFAPVHNPANLEGIEAVERILGSTIPQVAVFDTAFHSTLPPKAYTYPVPYEWLEQGIRKYGFHGTSHQYCAQKVAQLLGCALIDLRVVTCHLGNGCSLAAIKEGNSIDTTMGFTPLEGLMMGSRSGSIDPSILIHRLRQGDTIDILDLVLNKKSGLQGVSGISNDLRQVIEASEKGNPRAQLALEIYIHRLCYHLGGMVASLGGLDVLVFTAGVGENSAWIREQTCLGLEFLGIKLDRDKNNQHPVDRDISTPDSRIKVFVIHTQEDWAIATQCFQVLNQKQL